jgi:tetratricopeptide (TPR) repeat protein
VVVQRLDSFKVMISRVARGGLYAEGTSGCNLALGRKIDVMNRPRTATVIVLAALGVSAAAVPAGANPESKALRAKAAAQVYNLDRDDAMATFRQAIAADPEDAAAYRGLATTLWLSVTFRRGNMTVDDYMGRVSTKSDGPPTPAPPETAAAFTAAVDKALAIARRRVAANPRDPDAHFELGAAVGLRASYVATVDGSAMGAFRSAREAYNEHEQVLKLAPARKDAGLIVGTYRYLVASLALPVRLMAYVVGFGGDKDRGVRMIEEAAAYGGDNEADARFALLLLYNREQRYDDALRELAGLRARFPRNRLAWLETGSTSLRAGRAADAERVLNEGMTRFADDRRPRMFGEDALWAYKRGAARAALNRTEDAQADFRRAVAVEGRPWVHGRSHFELGKVALKAGDRARANEEFRAAVKLCESDGDAGIADQAKRLIK